MSNLARPRAKGRARGQRAWAHAEARAERWRDVAEEVAAAGAAAIVGNGTGGIGAEPVAAGFTHRIDALHGETGQILHWHSLSGRQLCGTRTACATEAPLGGPDRLVSVDSAARSLWCQEN